MLFRSLSKAKFREWIGHNSCKNMHALRKATIVSNYLEIVFQKHLSHNRFDLDNCEISARAVDTHVSLVNVLFGYYIPRMLPITKS